MADPTANTGETPGVEGAPWWQYTGASEPVVHLSINPDSVACMSGGKDLQQTTKTGEVTCRSCQRTMQQGLRSGTVESVPGRPGKYRRTEAASHNEGKKHVWSGRNGWTGRAVYAGPGDTIYHVSSPEPHTLVQWHPKYDSGQIQAADGSQRWVHRAELGVTPYQPWQPWSANTDGPRYASANPEEGIEFKAAGIAVIAMDTGRVLMLQRALNPVTCPCGQPVTWDEQNGYQHDDGSVDHDQDEFAGQTVSDLLDAGHPLEKEAAEDEPWFHERKPAILAPWPTDGPINDWQTENDRVPDWRRTVDPDHTEMMNPSGDPLMELKSMEDAGPHHETEYSGGEPCHDCWMTWNNSQPQPPEHFEWTGHTPMEQARYAKVAEWFHQRKPAIETGETVPYLMDDANDSNPEWMRIMDPDYKGHINPSGDAFMELKSIHDSGGANNVSHHGRPCENCWLRQNDIRTYPVEHFMETGHKPLETPRYVAKTAGADVCPSCGNIDQVSHKAPAEEDETDRVCGSCNSAWQHSTGAAPPDIQDAPDALAKDAGFEDPRLSPEHSAEWEREHPGMHIRRYEPPLDPSMGPEYGLIFANDLDYLAQGERSGNGHGNGLIEAKPIAEYHPNELDEEGNPAGTVHWDVPYYSPTRAGPVCKDCYYGTGKARTEAQHNNEMLYHRSDIDNLQSQHDDNPSNETASEIAALEKKIHPFSPMLPDPGERRLGKIAEWFHEHKPAIEKPDSSGGSKIRSTPEWYRIVDPDLTELSNPSGDAFMELKSQFDPSAEHHPDPPSYGDTCADCWHSHRMAYGFPPSHFEQTGHKPLVPEPRERRLGALQTEAALEYDNNEGVWEFPGGCLEPGEQPRAAAVREFAEEVGQALPPGVFVGAWLSPGGITVAAASQRPMVGEPGTWGAVPSQERQRIADEYGHQYPTRQLNLDPRYPEGYATWTDSAFPITNKDMYRGLDQPMVGFRSTQEPSAETSADRYEYSHNAEPMCAEHYQRNGLMVPKSTHDLYEFDHPFTPLVPQPGEKRFGSWNADSDRTNGDRGTPSWHELGAYWQRPEELDRWRDEQFDDSTGRELDEGHTYSLPHNMVAWKYMPGLIPSEGHPWPEESERLPSNADVKQGVIQPLLGVKDDDEGWTDNAMLKQWEPSDAPHPLHHEARKLAVRQSPFGDQMDFRALGWHPAGVESNWTNRYEKNNGNFRHQADYIVDENSPTGYSWRLNSFAGGDMVAGDDDWGDSVHTSIPDLDDKAKDRERQWYAQGLDKGKFIPPMSKPRPVMIPSEDDRRDWGSAEQVKRAEPFSAVDMNPNHHLHPMQRMNAVKPVYKGFIYLIQNEKDLDLASNRGIVNPDDPDGDMTEQCAWWDIEDAKNNPALRPECQGTPWDELALWADKSVRSNRQVQAMVRKLAGIADAADEYEPDYEGLTAPGDELSYYENAETDPLVSERSDLVFGTPPNTLPQSQVSMRKGPNCATCYDLGHNVSWKDHGRAVPQLGLPAHDYVDIRRESAFSEMLTPNSDGSFTHQVAIPHGPGFNNVYTRTYPTQEAYQEWQKNPTLSEYGRPKLQLARPAQLTAEEQEEDKLPVEPVEGEDDPLTAVRARLKEVRGLPKDHPDKIQAKKEYQQAFHKQYTRPNPQDHAATGRRTRQGWKDWEADNPGQLHPGHAADIERKRQKRREVTGPMPMALDELPPSPMPRSRYLSAADPYEQALAGDESKLPREPKLPGKEDRVRQGDPAKGEQWWEYNPKTAMSLDRFSQQNMAFPDREDGKAVYARFGDWPANERSMNHIFGRPEEGVSVYDLDKEGNPLDPDSAMDRGFHYGPDDDEEEPERDLDFMDDTHGMLQDHIAEARRGHNLRPNSRAHLVRGQLNGFGHDDEPVLGHLEKVGHWPCDVHKFIPGMSEPAEGSYGKEGKWQNGKYNWCEHPDHDDDMEHEASVRPSGGKAPVSVELVERGVPKAASATRPWWVYAE